MLVEVRRLRELLEEVKSYEELFAKPKEVSAYPESLLVDNGVKLHLANNEGYSLYLLSTGDVSIIDETDDYRKYKGDQRFENKELMEEIKNGKIHTQDSNYIVDMNNWFEVYVYNPGGDIVEDYVYESEPEDPIEMILELIEVLGDATLEDLKKNIK